MSLSLRVGDLVCIACWLSDSRSLGEQSGYRSSRMKIEGTAGPYAALRSPMPKPKGLVVTR